MFIVWEIMRYVVYRIFGELRSGGWSLLFDEFVGF